MLLQFGDFVLDSQRRQVRKGEQPVHLTPKALELLGALIDRRPEAVSKDALERSIWGQTHVAETSLAGLVAELRTALGDSPREPRFVRTVHGFGYAFCAEAASSDRTGPLGETALVYRIVWDRREVSLRVGENILGRDPDAVAWIDSPTVSRRHARIVIALEGAALEDLGSHNGTFLRGERIASAVPLHDRDEIRLGSVSMTFRAYTATDTESQSL